MLYKQLLSFTYKLTNKFLTILTISERLVLATNFNFNFLVSCVLLFTLDSFTLFDSNIIFTINNDLYLLLATPMYFDESQPLSKVYSKIKSFYFLHTYFSENLLTNLSEEDTDIVMNKIPFKDYDSIICSKNADQALLERIDNYKATIVEQEQDDSSILSSLISGFRDRLKDINLSIEDRAKVTEELKALVADNYHLIKEQKAEQTRELKLAARRERAAKKKAVLGSFASSSLYNKLCCLLGYDIKQKIKTCSYNSKWLKGKNPSYVSPDDFNFDFITYDIEAYLDESDTYQPYQFGLYHPNFGYKSFYGVSCIQQAFDFILNYNYDTTEVVLFAHNGGKFDTIFLIKELNNRNIDNIHVLKDKNNSFFLLQFSYNGVEFKFKDSFKFMPLGLDKLLKDFGIDVNGLVGKLPFDHSWMSAQNIHYNGTLPKWLEAHAGTLESLSIPIKPFSIQRYCEFYNRIDCIGLHKLIYKFFYQFVKDFKMDLTYCVTLPQLSMDLFRSKWLDSNNAIRLLSNQHYNFIKEAYKGANVSVYKPYGEKLYAYDINSLYPYCMLKPMPVGTPKPYDISRGLDKLFGFAECIVSCPSNLKIPVLPVKCNIEGVEKLVFPTGEFRGVWFSEELKYAVSLGYKVTLKKAIQFEKNENLFHGFVNFFYDRKANSKGASKSIAKLCLNSLYGRFAMQKDFDFNVITNNNDFMNVIEQYFTNINPLPLSEESVLFSFSLAPNLNLKESNPEIYDFLNKHYQLLCASRIGNIAIAAAITAYSRCAIDPYKRIPGSECYHSDTDCVHLSSPLPAEYLGDGLGQMKNELSDENYSIVKDASYFYSKGVFLRDKVYSIVLQCGAQITKFSGLNRKLIPKNSFDLLFNVYKNGGDLTLLSPWTRRCVSSLVIGIKNENKTFTFNYDKRVMVRDSNGDWIDTVPIELNLKGQKQDLFSLIRKQSLNSPDKYGLVPFKGTINQQAVVDEKYKHFDGYFLNYTLPVDQDPLTTLKKLVELATQEGTLVSGVHYLLSEGYKGRVNTISYLNNFKSQTELLNIYQQHLDSLLNMGVSGKILNSGESGYIIDSLSLRIRIPSELKPKQSSPS